VGIPEVAMLAWKMVAPWHRLRQASTTGRREPMILLGCLLALGIAVAPRFVLVLAWIFSDRWPIVWGDAWIAPLLGIIFLPFTTVMYMLVWSAGGIQGWDWLWIGLGLFIDITHYAQAAANRNKVPGYGAATAAVAGGGSTPTQAPAATPLPAAPPVAALPVAAPPPTTPAVAAPPIESPPAVTPMAAPPPEEESPDAGPSGP
jgi:hypothetical protein